MEVEELEEVSVLVLGAPLPPSTGLVTNPVGRELLAGWLAIREALLVGDEADDAGALGALFSFPLPAPTLLFPLEPPDLAPFGTQLSPWTLANLLFVPGRITFGPGSGYSGSVLGSVLHELISARFATKSSGNWVSRAMSSTVLLSHRLDFDPLSR